MLHAMTRKFYPCESHVSTGSTDLGRDCEIQSARLFCMNLEKHPDPPVTVIASGDTGFFTDGALMAVQHLAEARERGFRMPIVFLVHANNSSISSRLGGVDRVLERFRSFGSLVDEGFVTRAEDVKGGIQAMRQASDQARKTGRATFVLTTFPFRPGGHAADQNPAPEVEVLDQFWKTKEVLKAQLGAAAFRKDSSGRASTGPELAAILAKAAESIENACELAVSGSNILTRDEARELSQPGILELENSRKEPGMLLEGASADYLLGRGQTEFSGMGSDIYGRAVSREMDKADAEGFDFRYVHQENHDKEKFKDSRGGVYGELNAVEVKHTEKFVNFLPQEAQVMQVGAAFRSVLKEKNRVFVKGPHTIFNEHARDHMKYE